MLDVVFELFEAWTHLLLYERGVYPQAAFSRRIKYGVPMWQCEDVHVHNYISHHLRVAYEALNTVKQNPPCCILHLVLLTESKELETYVFEAAASRKDATATQTLSEIELHARSILLKTRSLVSKMKPFDSKDSSSFKIRIQLNVENALKVTEDLEWSSVVEPERSKSAVIEPLYEITSPFELQLYAKLYSGENTD